MLSYQHIYHAGNFADVQKHSLLIRLLSDICQDEAPLSVLDTHAGRGFYDLSSREAQKTGEHVFGVSPLWKNRQNVKQDSLIGAYLSAVGKYNSGHALTRYPGSARIARDALRPMDKLVAAERHPGEFQELAKAFRHDTPATTDIFEDDGLLGLTEAAPGPGIRGVAVIDPSYEIKNEYAAIPRALAAAWQAWPNGCALIWYPILPALMHETLLSALADARLGTTLVSEIRLTHPPKPGYRMQGSGVAFINAPWTAEQLTVLSEEIADALSPACGEVIPDIFTL